MSLAAEFLSHAADLVAPTAPLDPISLRRVVSASYYALFHQIIEDAAEVIGPNVSLEINHRIQRWFEHGTMKQICGRFLKTRLEQPLKDLIGDSASPDLQTVCSTFISSQEARHEADYNPGYAIDLKEALQQIQYAVTAIDAWKRIRASSEANVFILSLLLFKNWDRDR